jgi:hypothetical protein
MPQSEGGYTSPIPVFTAEFGFTNSGWLPNREQVLLSNIDNDKLPTVGCGSTGPARHFPYSGSASGGLARIDDGSATPTPGTRRAINCTPQKRLLFHAALPSGVSCLSVAKSLSPGIPATRRSGSGWAHHRDRVVAL